MPRPATPLDLVYSPGKYFPYQDWEDHLKTYTYFRVHGFNEFRRDAGLHDNSVVEDAALVARAKAIVQREWGMFLPPASGNKDDINTLGKNQIKRVRMRKPVAFQTACLGIVALELALADRGCLIDIYDHKPPNDPHRIAICPAIFQVDDYNKSFYETNIKSNHINRAALVKDTYQSLNMSGSSTDNVFLDMAEGHLVTEWLASTFVTFWSSRMPLPTISPCKPRTKNKYRKPSNLEVQYFPLS